MMRIKLKVGWVEMKTISAKLLKWLKSYSATKQMHVFKQFRDGAIYFSVGLLTIYLANSTLAPSVSQEIIVLLGLVLTFIGFVMAMLAQIKLIASRLYHFFFNDH